MNNLPKEVDERIGKEAVEEAKKRCLRTASFRYGYEHGYYDGGTAEATRAMQREKVLVEALRKIEQMSDPGNEWKAICDMKAIASKALTNYAGEGEVGNG